MDSFQYSQSHLSQIRLSQSSSSSSLPLIPGPAGVVQAAMRRKTLDRQTMSSQETPIPTQEYIWRAVEDPVEDQDFKKRPWLSAMEFLTVEGTYYSLSSLKKLCYNVYRADQVVAVVKSCRPNGLDDLILTLKDSTDTIEASVHHKVLTESPFGRDRVVCSFLILQKVVLFAKSPRSVSVLNIILPNVFKVIPKC